jgi:HK97 family phage portal protein
MSGGIFGAMTRGLGAPHLERRENPVGGAISAWQVGAPVWTDRRYDKLADEGFGRNAIANKCIRLIATSAAMTPWLLYDKAGNEIENHPLLDLLSRPAPMIGGHALFEAFYAYLVIAGNSYLIGETLSSGRPPVELWPMRPDRVKVIAGPGGMPQGYQYEAHGQTLVFPVDPLTGAGDVLHVKEFHPTDDWYGLGRTEAAAYGIDRHNEASAHNMALLQNGARPSGALIFEPVKGTDGTEQSAPKEVITAAREELEDRHGGASKAGKPFVFGGNVRWEEMGTSPKDMDFNKGKEDAARDICTAYGVPHLLIVPGSDTYSNKAQASLELWQDTVLPLLDRTVDALNAWLVPRFGDGLRLAVDLDEISALEPVRESKRKSTLELVTAGVLDVDEARDALQYAPRNANSVKKVEATVLAALVSSVATAGMEPLFRYLISTGLLPSGTTLEKFTEAATTQFDDVEGAVAALLPTDKVVEEQPPEA